MHLGLDLGRTWLRASLADDAGHILRRVRIPAVPWRRLPEAMPVLRRMLGFRKLERLTVGATGIWTPAEKIAAKRLLRGWARCNILLSDVELAHRAAFMGPGILVVGGTGAVAIAQDQRSRMRRVGGWGPLLGDEGSAFWIGRAALHDSAICRKLKLNPLTYAHDADPVRAVARLALRVFRLAPSHPGARRIRTEAAQALADLAAAARQGLKFAGPIPIVGWGGLFRDRSFAELFRRALRRQDTTFVLKTPLMAAEDAAATGNI